MMQIVKEYIRSMDKMLVYKLAGLVLLYILFITVFLMPEVKNATKYKKRKQELRVATQRALNDAKRFSEVSQERLQKELRLREATKWMASDSAVKNILGEISEMATLCKVTVLEIMPNTSQLPLSEKAEVYCGIQGFRIDLRAGFHQIGEFIGKLENYQYIIRVESLKIIPGDLADNKLLARLKLVVISRKRGFLDGL